VICGNISSNNTVKKGKANIAGKQHLKTKIFLCADEEAVFHGVREGFFARDINKNKGVCKCVF